MPTSTKLLEMLGLEAPSCGSIWRVAESVWKKVIPDYYQDSDRKGHYGLAMGERPHKRKTLKGAYGMFIGSSRKRDDTKCLVVRGVSPYESSSYVTYFPMVIRPVPQRYFVHDDPEVKISRKDFKRAVGAERFQRHGESHKASHYRPPIILNHHKEALNEQEQCEFEALLTQLGV